MVAEIIKSNATLIVAGVIIFLAGIGLGAFITDALNRWTNEKNIP